MKKFLLTSLLAVATSLAAFGEPKTTIMYYDADMETKFSGGFRNRNYAWPVLRIGVAHNKDRHFAMIRIQVGKNTRRSEIMRQLVDCACIAFKLDRKLQQADLDAVLADDTSTSKAEPLFAVSLKRSDMTSYRPEITPESWLKTLAGYHSSPQLLPDRDPVQVATDSIFGFFSDSLLRLPIYKPKTNSSGR